MRILVATHSWSYPNPGGAELAAHNLATALRASGHAVQLVACVPGLSDEVGYDHTSDTVLVRSGTEPRSFVWGDTRTAETWDRLLRSFDPDVVHLHHYINLGADLPLVAKHSVPRTTVILTLHEYLAICAQDGQMLTRDRRLCTESGVRKCAECLGSTAADVALHRHTLLAQLRHVDRFVAPSEFLRSRYVAWGIEPERIVVLPNVVRLHDRSAATPVLAAPPVPHPQRRRFVFMSQHTPYKGLDILLDALLLLQGRDPDLVEQIDVEVWGDGIDRFGPEWTERIDARRRELGPWVGFRGSYRPSQAADIYARADWTIVPSIWWENRPLVIEESLASGVPVIASNIGGMAELVNAPDRGVTVPPSDATALADAIAHAAASAPPAVSYSATTSADHHLKLYEDCIGHHNLSP